MSSLGTSERPLRVAIVGSGPSGFYAAEALFKADVDVQVDMFERLPTPFGLVRGGVAPDHGKIKTVTRIYDKIARKDQFALFANVTVGGNIDVNELRRFYDVVIFASGAETDRKLGIPGENLPGSHTATEFVGWYNGHPDYRDREFDLTQEVAVIIGQGNVAVDVCRILAKSPDELAKTDIAEHALEVLAQSRIREIHMIGRRGPVQAKFTSAEIREMGELSTCGPVVRSEDLVLDPVSEQELNDPSNKQIQKNIEILQEFAARPECTAPRRFYLHFLESPVALKGEDRVQSIVLERNRLEGEPFRTRAVGTGETVELPCGLVFRSVGYRGVALPGVPYDEHKGIFPNEKGRIRDEGGIVPGLYAVGWIKRGPSGVIGTNKPDSVETVQCILEDLPNLPPCPEPDEGAVRNLLRERGVEIVDFAAWCRIDEAEVKRGEPKEKPREKFTRIHEMIQHAR